jgi:hypothetical protein
MDNDGFIAIDLAPGKEVRSASDHFMLFPPPISDALTRFANILSVWRKGMV